MGFNMEKIIWISMGLDGLKWVPIGKNIWIFDGYRWI